MIISINISNDNFIVKMDKLKIEFFVHFHQEIFEMKYC